MAANLQMNAALRNAILDAIETYIGTSPRLDVKTGAAPATCATADSGTVLASMTLPSDWMAAASSGTKAKSGTWEDVSANATGTAAHFRIYTSGGTCVMQGTVGTSASDLIVSSTSFTSGDSVTINTAVFTASGA